MYFDPGLRMIDWREREQHHHTIYMHAHAHTYIPSRTDSHTCTHYTHYIYIHTHTHTAEHMHKLYTHTHTYIHSRTGSHTYTHTHTYRVEQVQHQLTVYSTSMARLSGTIVTAYITTRNNDSVYLKQLIFQAPLTFPQQPDYCCIIPRHCCILLPYKVLLSWITL